MHITEEATNMAQAGKAKRVAATREVKKLTKAIHIQRLANLKKLIDQRFSGNATAAGRAIARTHTFMWQLLNEHRAIGEDTARHIELMLKLAPNAMDQAEAGGRTRELIANQGDGSAAVYRMTPRRELEAFTAKPVEWRPFPIEGASENVFFSTILHSTIAGLWPGDLAFADQADVTLKTGGVYVIAFKMKNDIATILSAKKRSDGSWSFVTTFDDGHKPEAYARDAVRVIARVVSIVRQL
jgi:hypothetical protein